MDWMMLTPGSPYFENVDASPHEVPGIVVVAGRVKPRIVRVARFAATAVDGKERKGT